MVRAVVDTNLIVSGTASPQGTPHDLLESWRRGDYILVTSISILEEIADVLTRPAIREYFHLSDELIADVIQTLTTRAFVTTGTTTLPATTKDPDDEKFLAAAVEGAATHVVTGDKKHLLSLEEYQGVKIVTARHFLDACLK